MTLLLTDGGRQARAQALSTVLRAHLQRRLDLPPSLRPWGAQLSVLPTDLALSIGPWLPRLAQAVGPLATEVTATTGEPQGYGGLARRGPYDRLLLGEWLLADELPDEFLRRAIDGEHVFYELSHRAPVDRRRVVVLFDGGPQQLGGPRIAQLALLLLFARRAEAAGADLAWGVLQDPQRRLLDGATRSSVEHLLDGSSALGVEDELLERWCQTLAASGGPDDLWLVGEPALVQPARDQGASSVVIRDRLEPGLRQLEVAVRRGLRPAALVDLDLPAAGTCARLVREPFGTSPRPTPRPSPWLRGKPLGAVLTDTRVCLQESPRQLITCPFPNTPRGAPGMPRRHELEREETPLAVGFHGKRMFMVVVDERGDPPLKLLGYGADQATTGHRQAAVDVEYDPAQWLDPEPVVTRCVPLNKRGEVGFVLPDGRLVVTRPHGQKRHLTASRIVPGTWAIAGQGGQLYALGSLHPTQERLARNWLYFTQVEPGEPRIVYSERMQDPAEVRFFLGPRHTGVFAAVAVEPGRWVACDGEGTHEVITPPRDLEVVGALWPDEQRGPGLLVLEAGGRELTLLGRSGNLTMGHTADPIEHVVVGGHTSLAAVVTAAGEVYVLSPFHDEPLLRVRTEVTP